MLSMSELAMNPNRKVTTVCYGKKQDQCNNYEDKTSDYRMSFAGLFTGRIYRLE